MRIAIVVTVGLLCGYASAKLPQSSEAAQAAAAEAAAKTAWSEKVAAYQLCLAQDRAVDAYRASLRAAGKPIPIATGWPPCTDPGQNTPITPMASKPLEASGAHSPPGTAVSPPSESATSKEIADPRK